MKREPTSANTPLTKKLGIVDDAVFTVIDPPDGFAETLGDHGDAVWQHNLLPPIDVVVAFFTHRVRLTATWPRLIKAAEPAGAVWVCWPKPSSGLSTDLTANVLSAELLPTGWVDNKACTIDDDWSAMRFVKVKDTRPHRLRR